MNETVPRGVSISWVGAHRRSVEIATVVGAEAYFIRSRSRTLVLRYFRQYIETRRLLKRLRPAFVIVMQPPVLALAAVAFQTKRTRSLIIGDLHSGTFFDAKWRWASKWVLGTLRRRGGAIVPNADLAEICMAAGVKVFVNHGWIEPLANDGQRLPAALPTDRPFVLVPFTYASDEPVRQVIAAAAKVPDVTWVLTGNAPRTYVRMAPKNVFFSGFVPQEQFEALRLRASAILALTNRPSTMQSAGYEAVSSATPLITVAEPVLQAYFGDCAYYASLSAEALADAVQTVVDDNEVWKERIESLQNDVVTRQPDEAALVRQWILSRTSQKQETAR